MTKLSSPITFIFKYVFTGLFVLFSVFLAWHALSSSNVILAGITIVGLFIGLTVIHFSTGNLKQISIAGEYLIVTGYSRKVEVPITNVVDVGESDFPAGVFWIKLEPPCHFGERVRFMPIQKSIFPGGREKQVKEIRDLINETKRKSA